MLWLYTALLSAIAWGAINTINKHVMQDLPMVSYLVLYTFFTSIVYLPVFVYSLATMTIAASAWAWLALGISVAANVVGFVTLNAALKAGELSVTVPLAKITPVFVALNAFVLLGESLTVLNVTGILAVTCGSYIVLLHHEKSLLEPFKRLQHHAPRLALVSAFAYSIAAVADRFATQQIHPRIYTFLIYVSMLAVLLGYAYLSEHEYIAAAMDAARDSVFRYVGIGVIGVSGSLFVYYALSMAEATRVIPVLQTQVLISVAAGGYLFREEGIMRKLLGSVLMIGGVTMAAV